jgi:hypothetical protein
MIQCGSEGRAFDHSIGGGGQQNLRSGIVAGGAVGLMVELQAAMVFPVAVTVVVYQSL